MLSDWFFDLGAELGMPVLDMGGSDAAQGEAGRLLVGDRRLFAWPAGHHFISDSSPS